MQAKLIYIAGDKSQVGKTSVCLGLLASLLDNGYAAEDIGYVNAM